MNKDNSSEYFLSPHPGEILKGEIEEHGLSQRELASAIGKSATMVNGILNGSKDITVEIAILLEAALPGGMKAKDWLRLQNEHDLDKKRSDEMVKSRKTAIEIWNYLRENSNLNALRRRLDFGNDFVRSLELGNTLFMRKLYLKHTYRCFWQGRIPPSCVNRM